MSTFPRAAGSGARVAAGAEPATGEPLRRSAEDPSEGRRPGPQRTPDAAAPQVGAQQPLPADDGWVRVRVVAPTGALDVSLPLARDVADLVDELVTVLVPGAALAPVDSSGGPGRGSGGAGTSDLAESWHLQRLGAAPFDPSAALSTAHVVDGEVLHLYAGRAVPAAVAVDDALAVLAAGAARTGVWTTRSATGLLAAGAVAVGAGTGLLALLLAPDTARGPGGWAAALPALALTLLLLVAATWLRRDGGDVVALAALPVWACAGAAFARGAASPSGAVAPGAPGGSLLPLVVGAATAVAVGALVSWGAVPGRAPWWAAAGTAGTLVAGAGALALGGPLTLAQTAAALAVVLVGLVGGLPHLLARTPLWSSDAPAGRTTAELVSRGRASRALLSALAAAIAGVACACLLVLVLAGSRPDVVLALVLAVVTALRARRSRFVVESASLLWAGAIPLGAAVARAALTTSPSGQQAALLAGVLVLAAVLAVLVVVRRAARGAGAAAQRLTRPRVRRTLNTAEGVAAVAVLPLLGWALGLYGVAADAGARL